MYRVEITLQYTGMNELHFFNTLKEANDFLISKGYFYDSGDDVSDLWVFSQFIFAEVTLAN